MFEELERKGNENIFLPLASETASLQISRLEVCR